MTKPPQMWACLMVHPRTGEVHLHVGNRATVIRCAASHPRISHAVELSSDTMALPRHDMLIAATKAVRQVNPDFKY